MNTNKTYIKVYLKVLLSVGIAVLSLISTSTQSQAQLITNLTDMGQTSFSIDDDISSLPYTQTPTSLKFDTGFSLGATVGGVWNPEGAKDWSSYSLTDFGIIAAIVGTNPNTPFTIEFYDSNLDIANTFTGSTSGIGASPTFSPILFSLAGSGQMDDIIGIGFTFDSPDTIDMTWDSIAVVPEPSTYLLLALGLIACATSIFIKTKGKYNRG